MIVAAGSGSRMNLGYNKVFYQFDDQQSVLEKAVRCFDCHNQCAEIVIVTQKENFDLCQFDCATPLILCEGGTNRQDSVFQGLLQTTKEFVMIHDGARPFVDVQLLEKLAQRVCEVKACILAVPCKDTIKVVHHGQIQETPDRNTLYQAQTPQAFERNLLMDCYLQAKQKSVVVTDDASIVETFSTIAVEVVEGSYRNIKITTLEDLNNNFK